MMRKQTTRSVGRGVMNDHDQCFVPDENDNCIECGKRMELPEITETPDLGDIMGMIRLIDETSKAYLKLVQDNTDPNDPSQPRLRVYGGIMTRVPHSALYLPFFRPSYAKARSIGYRGPLDRWIEILQEAVSTR